MKLGLIGYGNVGRGFARLVDEKRECLAARGHEIIISCALDSGGGVLDPNGLDLRPYDSLKGRQDYVPGLDARSIVEGGYADMIVELTPTDLENPAVGLGNICAALEAGLHVVTGNKGPIVSDYRGLKAIADKKGVYLGVGCCCGGALPGLNMAVYGISGGEVLSMEGVLNGTTNYILKEMERMAFSEALKLAQEQGIAEKNYRYDIDGYDTAVKLLIIANIGLGLNKGLRDVEIEGISGITPGEVSKALAEGKKIKLVGSCQRDGGGYSLCVAPKSIGPENPLYFADGKNKGLVFKTDCLGQICVSGGASGTVDAAGAILRDILNIHNKYGY